MHEQGRQLERLETEVRADAGCAGFPLLAELYRRDGRPADAEAVARAGLALRPAAAEGRVALALALLDRGLEREARCELEALFSEVALGQGIAFVRDAVDADEAARAASPPEPDAAATRAADRFVGAGAFATETMAGLLERQGDREGAERIRAALEPARDEESAEAPAHVLRQLERWLANAQQRMGERA